MPNGQNFIIEGNIPDAFPCALPIHPCQSNFNSSAIDKDIAPPQYGVSYSVFHRFKQAKFENGGLTFSSSKFSILPQLPQKMEFASKGVKADSKIISLLPISKSVKLTVPNFKNIFD